MIELTESKIVKAADEISASISATILAFQKKLASRHGLSQQQLAVAITVAHMQLLAANVAGTIIEPDASEDRLRYAVEAVVRRIQLVIGDALEYDDRLAGH
jgi:hypothetical protein